MAQDNDTNTAAAARPHSSGGRIALPVLFFVFTTVYAFLFFADPQAPSAVIFLFDFIYLVLFPGFVLAGLFVDPRRPLLKAVFSLALGAALFYILLLLTILLPIDVTATGWLVPILTALAVSARAIAWRGGGKDGSELISAEPAGMRTGLIMLLLLAVCALLVLAVGDPLLYSGDSPDHIAYIRAVAREGQTFPDRFLYAEGGRLTSDIRKGLAHSMWGALNAIRGNLEIAPLWKYISLITTLWTVAAIYTAGVMLSRRPAIGLIAAALFVLIYHRGLCAYQLITTAYGFPSGKIFYLAFLALLPLLAGRATWRPLLLAYVAAFCAVATHVAHALLIAFIVALAGAYFTLSAPPGKRIVAGAAPWIRAAFWIALACAPYLALRYFSHYHPNNPIHQHVQGTLTISRGLITANPLVFFRIAGELFLLATVAVFFLWGYSRDQRMLRLLLLGVIAILVLVFNPLAMPLIIDVLLYLIFRLEYTVPSMIVSAWLLVVLWDWTFSYTPRRRGRAAVGWIVAGLILAPRLAQTPAGFAYAGDTLREVRRRSCLNAADLYAAVQQIVPPGGIVASDPATSYCIPAFTDRFVVCTYDQHSVPNDSTAAERIVACRDIFSPAVPIKGAVALLERYGAEYVAVNGRLPGDIPFMYWKPGEREALAAMEKFLAVEGVFETVWRGDNVWLLKYLGPADIPAEADSALPVPKAPPSPPADVEAAVPVPSGLNNIYITALEARGDTVARGERVHLTVDWVRTGDVPAGNYIAYFRFDTRFPKGALYNTHYGKIYRKVIERIRGERFRFRHDHFPFRGIHPPDLWPQGLAVRDVLEIKVPEDIAAGEYSISVRLARVTQYPNYDLGDFLRDEDVFAGRAVGVIVIR